MVHDIIELYRKYGTNFVASTDDGYTHSFLIRLFCLHTFYMFLFFLSYLDETNVHNQVYICMSDHLISNLLSRKNNNDMFAFYCIK